MKQKVEIALGFITIGVFITIGERLTNFVIDSCKKINQDVKKTKPKQES